MVGLLKCSSDPLSVGRSTDIGRMTDTMRLPVKRGQQPAATERSAAGFRVMMDTMTESIVAFDTALGTCAVRWNAAGIASVRLPGPRTAGLPRLADDLAVPDDV